MRKHKGINQTTGKLKKGYKYSGKKLKSGLSQIIKIKKSKRNSKRKLKRKDKKGGKVVGLGGFGCIIDPGVSCQGNKMNNKVSKLGKNLDISEINMGNKLKLIDPNKKYFLYIDSYCKIIPEHFESVDLELCNSKMRTDLSKGYNYIMDKGDINLRELKKKYSTTMEVMIKILLKLLECSEILLNNKLTHYDIKAENVMLRLSKDNMYDILMIDFGGEYNPQNWDEYNKNIKEQGDDEYFWPSEVWGDFPNFISPPYEPILFNKPQTSNNFLRPFSEKVMVYMIGKIYENSSKKDIQPIIKGMLEKDYTKRYTINQAKNKIIETAKKLNINITDLRIPKIQRLSKIKKIKQKIF